MALIQLAHTSWKISNTPSGGSHFAPTSWDITNVPVFDIEQPPQSDIFQQREHFSVAKT